MAKRMGAAFVVAAAAPFDTPVLYSTNPDGSAPYWPPLISVIKNPSGNGTFNNFSNSPQ
jgi:hypothetical protein